MKKLTVGYFILTIACLLSCAYSSKNATSEQKSKQMQAENWEIIEKGNQCAIYKAGSQVIKGQAEFAEMWAKTFNGIDMAPTQPSIDFSKKWIIAAFLGQKNNGGFSLDITSITNGKDSTIIMVEETQPGANCMTTMSIEFPFLFASIDQSTAKTVLFKTVVKKKDCE